MSKYQENLRNIVKLSVEKPSGFRSQVLDLVDDSMEEQALTILNQYKDTLALTIFNQ